MKVVFMGTPDFSVAVLEELIRQKFDIKLVVSQPDKKVGRGQKYKATPIKKIALANDIEVFQPDNINEHVEVINDISPDFIITCAYGQMLSENILNCATIKAINVHASLLPKHRGGAPIHRAILNGDEYTGVSIMEMVKEMDAGDIFIQEKIKIEYKDTLATVHDKLSRLGAKLLPLAIDKILNNPNCGTHQNSMEVSYSPNISKKERLLNFDDSSRNIYNKVRAFNPFPCATVMYDSNFIKILEVVELDKKSTKTPGVIVDITKEGIEVCTKDKNILITKLIIPGKSVMDALQFYNGNKLLSVGKSFN